jgi:hypothetical protein
MKQGSNGFHCSDISHWYHLYHLGFDEWH